MDHSTTVQPEAPAQKHTRTAGENAFDLLTYGGLAMGLNEGLSVAIINSGKDGKLKKYYEPFIESFKKLGPLSKIPYIGEGRMPYIIWGTIGGFVPVLPIKWLEDRKGSVVRSFDRMFHGEKADTDPEIAQAHATMDSKPPQTWRSLMEGRVTTVLAAFGVDYLVGWDKAASTKLAGEGKMKDWSSFNRFATSISRKLGMAFDKEHRSGIQHALDTVHDVNDRYKINVATEGKLASYLSTGIYLLTLNLGLTMMFYGTSHMYASGREKKNSKAAAPVPEKELQPVAQARVDTPEKPVDEQKPDTKVVQAETQSRVADAGAALSTGGLA